MEADERDRLEDRPGEDQPELEAVAEAGMHPSETAQSETEHAMPRYFFNGGSVHIEKVLGGATRLEPLHFTLPSSRDLMGVFGAIVRP